MEGSPATYSSTGSKGIITGSFAVIDYAEYLLEAYEQVVEDALKEEAKQEQERVRESARQSKTGWSKLANRIKVRYDHDERQLTYSVRGGASIQKQAMDLEYGTPDNPPVPLLRSSVIKGQYDTENNIDSYMVNRLSEGF